jgi:AcrR family transcriptional regulator
MSPRSDSQFEQIRLEKKQIIMRAALEVFAEKTYQGASVSMIAEKAKISKGLLYNYFTSKEALLKAIIQEGIQDVWQHFDPDNDGVLTKEEFLFFIKRSIQVVIDNPDYWKLYSSLMFQHDVLQMIVTDYDGLSAHYYKLAYDLFVRCRIKDPEAEMILFACMLKGAIIQYVAMPGEFPIEKFESAIENYYKGLLTI